MEYLTNIATSIFVGIGSSLVFTYGNIADKPKTLTPPTQVITAQSQKRPDYLLVSQSPPKYIKVNVNISNAEDLKIKEGDLVEAGQIITQSEYERIMLTREVDRINLLIKQTEAQQLIPTPLQFSQDIVPLPPHSLSPEEVAVDNARLQLDIVKGKYQAEVNKELYLEEVAAVEKAKAKVQQLQDAVQSQQTMIDELSLGIDQYILPEVENIIAHESQVLQSKIAELEKAEIDLNWQKAKLKNAQQVRKDRLINLVSQIEKSHGHLALARAQLEKAKVNRKYLENQHHLASLRRIEEANQIRQSDLLQQQTNKDLKLTQLREQLAQLEIQLANLSVVKSPYSGRIQSIKANKLHNNTFNVEIIFIPNSGDEFFNSIDGECAIAQRWRSQTAKSSCGAGSQEATGKATTSS